MWKYALILFLSVLIVSCSTRNSADKIGGIYLEGLSYFDPEKEVPIEGRIIYLRAYEALDGESPHEIMWMVTVGIIDDVQYSFRAEYSFPLLTPKDAAHVVHGMSGTADHKPRVFISCWRYDIVNEIKSELSELGERVSFMKTDRRLSYPQLCAQGFYKTESDWYRYVFIPGN